MAGSGAALTVLHYDGTWPVNVVTALATFVLLQLALVTLSLVLMLPDISGLRPVQRFLGSLNPATIVASVARRWTPLHDARAKALFWSEARGPAAARFARWQMLAWSQAAALAFNAAVLIAAFALVAFTDLAFGWSTTLRLDVGEATRIVRAVSFPWRELWPDAVPTAQLIENSRFFRLASAPPYAMAPSELTGWWPFLLAAIMTYGLLPRLLLTIVATARLRAAERRLLLDHPQVSALLDRMAAAEIELGSLQSEQQPIPHDARATPPPHDAGDAVVIIWSGAMPRERISEWVARQLQRRATTVVFAGVTLAQDREVITQLATLTPQTILLMVRAWEAPLLDLRDFIVELRERIGEGCSIVIVPVAVNGALASASESATWSRWTATIADPAVYMESGA
jgi:hypothetical protein